MKIENKSFDEERALYALNDAKIVNCVFDGPADGESALKEATDFSVKDSRFLLRYPLWHAKKFTVKNSEFGEGCRAATWYAIDGEFSKCKIDGVKFLRECKDMRMQECEINSIEFGWKCAKLKLSDCTFDSLYFLFESKKIEMKDCKMKGKYSFQYVEDMVIDNCEFDTKDAFWHAKNVTVRNSTIKGEYLGWYSDGLTLINCTIIGTQPLCYCEDLKLINCVMIDTDRSFEYSEVDADVKGSILSVKNPRKGKIVADSYGEIIRDKTVMRCSCDILLR